MPIFKVKYIVAFILSVTLMSGCVTTHVRNTETKSNEAIIFGRFIITGAKDINYKNVMVSLYSEDGSPIMAKLDKDGYFYTKAPIGKFYLDRFDYTNGLKTYSIPLEYKITNITNADGVHYIGDISLSWTPVDKYQTNKISLKIEKPLRDRFPAISSVVEIDNNTIDFFMKKFPENKKSIRISALR